MATSLQQPLFSVSQVCIVETFDCMGWRSPFLWLFLAGLPTFKKLLKTFTRFWLLNRNPLTPASNCPRPTPNFQAFYGIFQSERKHKINHMRSNNRHKIRFQDFVYLKFNKWTAKYYRNINKNNSTWCVWLVRIQEIIFFLCRVRNVEKIE